MWSRISSLVTRMDTSTGTWPLLFARSITVTCGRHLREKGDIRCISAHWTQGFHHGCDPSILSFCFCLFSLVCSSCFLFFFSFVCVYVCVCVREMVLRLMSVQLYVYARRACIIHIEEGYVQYLFNFIYTIIWYIEVVS